eukprot:GILJ01001509.1.p1 GENE.GILJ01001509.1~~GILJ01001509.1.p1  ORF type:complete len:385 (-),score=25.53 GILJ01001509.1:106-1260(-)
MDAQDLSASDAQRPKRTKLFATLLTLFLLVENVALVIWFQEDAPAKNLPSASSLMSWDNRQASVPTGQNIPVPPADVHGDISKSHSTTVAENKCPVCSNATNAASASVATECRTTTTASTYPSEGVFATIAPDVEIARLGLSDRALRFEAPPPKTQKRKVAVCITGAFRIFQRVRDTYIKFLLDPNEADVFAFGSYEAGRPEELEAVLRMPSLPGFRAASLRPFDEGAWLRYMRETHKYPQQYMDRSSWGIFAQWWNYDQCFALLEEYAAKHHLDYSEAVIMKVRPDLRFDTLTELTKEPTGPDHFHAMLFPFMNGRDFPEWYADYFTYGGYNAMKYITKLYEQIPYYKSIKATVAEDILYRYMRAKNFTVSTFPFMGWNIVRA